MRPLFIDFLADSLPSTDRTKWARRALWSTVLLLIAAEGAVFHKWHGDNERLGRQLASMPRESSLPIGTDPSMESPDQVKASQALASVSFFDPMSLARIERAVMSVRDKVPSARLRIDSLSFDARQRKIVLQGQSLQHQAINQLRDEIFLLLPNAVTSFPSLHDNSGGHPLQFEIGIRLSAETGSER